MTNFFQFISAKIATLFAAGIVVITSILPWHGTNINKPAVTLIATPSAIVTESATPSPSITSTVPKVKTKVEITPTPIVLPTVPVTNEKPKSENWNKSPKIVSISDNLGNNFDMICEDTGGCLSCYPKNRSIPQVSAKSVSEIKIVVKAQDPDNRPINYRFYSNDCAKDWSIDNSCGYSTKPDHLGKVSFAVMIKNDDSYNNNSGGCDAYSMIDYGIID